jgi:hypothetical protein
MMKEKTRKVWTIILFSFTAIFWITIVVLQELSIGKPQEIVYVAEPTLIIPLVDPTKAHIAPVNPKSSAPNVAENKDISIAEKPIEGKKSKKKVKKQE